MMRDRAAAYIACLEALTPERLPELSGHLALQARFKDPFNDVVGREAVIRVFSKMFEDVTDIEFSARDLGCSGAVCFFAWTLRCRLHRNRKLLNFEGATELHLDEDGRIAAHIDHWDAAGQLYAKLPFLGLLLNRLRRRLSAEEA